MSTYSFSYIAVTNHVTFDDFNFQAKIGIRKKEFPVANILHFYVPTAREHQAMYLVYTDAAGKRRKLTFIAALGEMGFMQMVAEMKMRWPEKSLHHLPEKEAFATMKVANPNKWAPIVVFFLLLFGTTFFVFPGLRHFFDGGHEHVTVEEVVGGSGLFGTRNVTIHGTLLDAGTEETTTSRRSGSSSSSKSTFVPIVGDNWQEGDPVQVVLEFKELSTSEYNEMLGTDQFIGVVRDVWWEGLAQDKVDFFKSEYGLKFTGKPVLIEVTDKETHNDAFSLIVFLVMFFIVLTLIIVVAIKRRNN